MKEKISTLFFFFSLATVMIATVQCRYAKQEVWFNTEDCSEVPSAISWTLLGEQLCDFDNSTGLYSINRVQGNSYLTFVCQSSDCNSNCSITANSTINVCETVDILLPAYRQRSSIVEEPNYENVGVLIKHFPNSTCNEQVISADSNSIACISGSRALCQSGFVTFFDCGLSDLNCKCSSYATYRERDCYPSRPFDGTYVTYECSADSIRASFAVYVFSLIIVLFYVL